MAKVAEVSIAKQTDSLYITMGLVTLRFSAVAKSCASKMATMARAVRAGSTWVGKQTSAAVELVIKLGALENRLEAVGAMKQVWTLSGWSVNLSSFDSPLSSL